MNFLDSLDPDDRDALVAIAAHVDVPRGSYLVRRGDPGGDLFVVQSGRMAVVDTRTRPTTIIATMEAGDVIGEVAFLDRTPRSADVCADSNGSVLHWRRADVNELIRANPTLGCSFFEALARVSVRRLRRVTAQTVKPSVSQTSSLTESRVDLDANGLIGPLKRTLRTVELALRRHPEPGQAEHDEAARTLITALDAAQVQLQRIGHAHTDTTDRDQLTGILRAELQPWLVRSFVAERSLRRAHGAVGSPETLSPILNGTPQGDGPLGELLDAWLLSRPTIRALRTIKRDLATTVMHDITDRRGRRVLLVNVGAGSLLGRLAEGLSDIPTTLTVLDPSRDALGYIDLADLPPNISLSAVRHELPALANGRLHASLPEQDAVIVDDVLCYLPDRLAMTLLRTVGSLVGSTGRLYATQLTPSPDAELLDLLLGWPTVRRTLGATQRLSMAVDMLADVLGDDDTPACILRANAPTRGDSLHTPLARAPSLF